MEDPDVSHIDDRIRALDPFAGVPYEHAAAAAMVERITTAGPARPHRRRLTVLVAPMTAVAAAGLVTGLLVTAGTTAPLLSAIHLQGSIQHAMGAGNALGLNVNAQDGSPIVDNGFLSTTGGMALPSAYAPTSSEPSQSANLYLSTTQFATAAPALAAVRVVSPASPPGVLAASASPLQVAGVVRRVAASAWRLGTASETHGVAGLYRSPSGLYDFVYARAGVATASSCLRGSPSGTVDTDRLAMGSATADLLAALGLRYELTAPTFETSWSRVGRTGCAGITTLGEAILVHGVPTDQVVRASFDPAGRLVAASFPVFMLGGTASYPLVSPATAAGALVRSSANFGALEQMGEPNGATSAGGAASSAHGTLRGLIIELRSSSISLRAFTTTSGATWLLPVYTLSGDGYTDLAASPMVWSGDVLATSAPLVRIVGAPVNQARVFDEQRRNAVP